MFFPPLYETPGFPERQSEKPPVSEKAFYGLKLAMENLSKYGLFAKDDKPMFSRLDIVNGMTRRIDVTPTNKSEVVPSHIYSGLMPTEGNSTHVQVWSRFEGSRADIQTIHNYDIELSTVLSQTTRTKYHGRGLVRNNIITTTDGRVLSSFADEPFGEAFLVNEWTNDPVVWTATYNINQAAKKLAEESPSPVDL